ncbi:PspC domain-containing protein [Streptomyces sp. NPDC020875]|uniref:PspC domain-containing protein n=1 Tax=Streptomyces sp. NPDC020875 TaxID=3154898 RepID=UPI0033E835C5
MKQPRPTASSDGPPDGPAEAPSGDRAGAVADDPTDRADRADKVGEVGGSADVREGVRADRTGPASDRTTDRTTDRGTPATGGGPAAGANGSSGGPLGATSAGGTADGPSTAPGHGSGGSGTGGGSGGSGASDGSGTGGGAGAGTGAGAYDDQPGPVGDDGGGGVIRPRQLRRDGRQRVIGGVCGGLGRYCDLDPVIFRVVLGVLAVTGGLGLIFYGFAWLLVPAEGEEESEGRKLLGGRVDGAALTAVFLALIGCGIFLTLLNNRGTLAFAAQLAIAATGVAVWSRRRTAPPEGAVRAPGAGPSAHAVPDAPPETKAPPAPDSPSWWRDPPARPGADGPAAPGYLWGPEDADVSGVGRDKKSAARRPRDREGPRSIGGTVFGLAALACYLGVQLSWTQQPLGISLQIGLAAALGVFGLGLVVSSFLGRTGFGTVFLTVVTALLLAGAASLPENIGTDWRRTTWRPATAAAVETRYELGTGVGVLDLSRVALAPGQTLTTSAAVSIGKAEVIVPAGVEVRLRAEAGVGDIRLPGDPKDDIDISPGQERNEILPAPRPPGPPGPGATAKAGTVELFVQVSVGQVEVTRARAAS